MHYLITDWQSALGALSFVLTAIALHVLRDKNRKAFVIFGVSCTIQFAIFCSMNQWFLASQMVVINLYNIRNYRAYGKKAYQRISGFDK